MEDTKINPTKEEGAIFKTEVPKPKL